VNGAVYDLLVPGHPSVDLMFSDLPSWPALGNDVYAGGLGVCAGTSFNTPAAANRLGLRVGYIATLGNDPWSAIVKAEIDGEAMPTDFIETVDRPLPFVSVAMNYRGDRGFVTYDARTDDDAREQAQRVREVVGRTAARHLHGYVGEELAGLAELVRPRGVTVSLDAWGGRWWDTATPLDVVLPHADVLFANEDEALTMSGADEVDAAASALADRVPCVVIKRGARGALAIDHGGRREAPGEPVEIVDATGAGDCFNAGFLYGWLSGLPLEHSLVLGNVCGARAVETFGGYRGCPTASEMATIAAERGIELPGPGRGLAAR
jgi:sugar/nucleoside kinase (ribokinase family)